MFNQENITRKSNLSENDSLSAYLEHASQQNHYAFEVFYNFISEVKPRRILEIGTAQGGFTMFLKLCCNDLNLNTNIRSYDIHGRHTYAGFIENGIDIRLKNVFSDDYTSVDSDVIEYIQSDGVTVVLCDGGCKISEFNILSNHIKADDFIMAHDYAPTTKFFNETMYKKLWNWYEIQDSDIHTAVDRNKLESYQSDNFIQAAWVCKIKR
jgi:hypothetical protein